MISCIVWDLETTHNIFLNILYFITIGMSAAENKTVCGIWIIKNQKLKKKNNLGSNIFYRNWIYKGIDHKFYKLKTNRSTYWYYIKILNEPLLKVGLNSKHFRRVLDLFYILIFHISRLYYVTALSTASAGCVPIRLISSDVITRGVISRWL